MDDLELLETLHISRIGITRTRLLGAGSGSGSESGSEKRNFQKLPIQECFFYIIYIFIYFDAYMSELVTKKHKTWIKPCNINNLVVITYNLWHCHQMIDHQII